MAGPRQTHPAFKAEPEPIGTYPMRVVSRLTGLNADTIRAWERRYSAIKPPRTGGNTRLFTREDIERLGFLRDLVALGHPIGRVASLSTAELVAALADDSGRARIETDKGLDPFMRIVDQYLEAIEGFEARRAMDVLHQAAAHLPLRDFIFKVVLPIVRSIGTRWSHGQIGVAHEHLATSHLRNSLLTYQHMHPVDRGASRMVVGSTEGHRHEFGLLIGALLAQLRGFDIVYLGVDLPADDLIWAARKSQADILLLAVSMQMSVIEGERLGKIASSLPERCETWLGLPASDPFEAPRVRRFSSFEEYELALLERR